MTGAVAEFLKRLRAQHSAWTITVHPLGRGLTAEHRSEDGRHIHYVVCPTSEDLAARLETAETVEP